MIKNSTNRYNVPAITSRFNDYLLLKNLSRISRKNYLSDLRMFLTWMNAHDDVPEFSVSTIISYKKHLESSRLPIRSINRSLSSIRAFGDLLINTQEQFSNPARLVANVAIQIHPEESVLVDEFSRSHELSKDDTRALEEFIKLQHDYT